MDYSTKHLSECIEIINKIDTSEIEKVADLFLDVKNEGGRVFFLGVGGSAGNCSHAVNDFRKIVEIESYAPTDNVSELTARTNDEGWNTIFEPWLKLSKLNSKDMVFIFSVGGGNIKKKVSVNLIKAIKYAKLKKGKTISIVGKKDGYAYKNSDISIIVNVENKKLITPVSETFQVLLWHLFVSHPDLQLNKTKW